MSNFAVLIACGCCAAGPGDHGPTHTLRGGGFELTGSVRWADAPPAAQEAAAGCAADCNGDGSVTPADLVCFLHRYSEGSGAANCDASTAAPILTSADFACFVRRYGEGCSK
jgi:hypothetical protein